LGSLGKGLGVEQLDSAASLRVSGMGLDRHGLARDLGQGLGHLGKAPGAELLVSAVFL
jgi:hypothetical protein